MQTADLFLIACSVNLIFCANVSYTLCEVKNVSIIIKQFLSRLRSNGHHRCVTHLYNIPLGNFDYIT